MKNIDKLLEKYFEGETTHEEEKILKAYFSKENIAAEHQIYAPIFQYFKNEQEALAKTGKSNTRKLIYIATAVAASLLLIIMGVKQIHNPSNSQIAQTTIYIDGKKVSDNQQMLEQALISIGNITDMDEGILDSQIDILESFTE